jgi:aminoglycoside phosphotransferase (APT) family kinase protein
MTPGIHIDNVTAWLVANVPAIRTPIEFSLIAGGHSNLTYRCTDAAGASYVLRRPPLGHVLESAHDMGREYRIITALRNSAVAVPQTFALCTDSAVNEAPFFVMAYVGGLVLNDSVAGASVPLSDRHALGTHVIDILCELHRLDPM